MSDSKSDTQLGARFRSAAIPIVVAIAGVAVVAVLLINPDEGANDDSVDAPNGVSGSQLPGPLEEPGSDYATSDACRDCHVEQHSSWYASYHRTMTQRATPESVLAPFGGETIESRGRSYRLFRDGDEFFVDAVDLHWEYRQSDRGIDVTAISDPPQAIQRIIMTTGSHHMQQYWVESRGGGGREIYNLPLVYHVGEERWMPREDTFLEPPGDYRHFKVWNMTCIACHAVGGKPKQNAFNREYYSEVVEFGIACEACHGPGAEHVKLRQQEQAGSARVPAGSDPIVNPEHLSQKLSAQACGQCHSVFYEFDREKWLAQGYSFRPGQAMEEERRILEFQDPFFYSNSPAAADHYWADGTMRIGGREYCAMVASECYVNGKMTCLSCHSMHKSEPNDQLGPGMATDKACLQCHDTFADRIEEHTHHAAKSDGSRCYNCHMPHTSYALFKAIRSHRVDSPNAAISQTSGRPSACNQCHSDRSLEWTGRYLRDWYGQEFDGGSPQGEGGVVAADVSSTVTHLLQGDAAQRIIAAWTLGWDSAHRTSGNHWQAPLLAPLLNDPYSTVRFVAYRSLRSLPGFEDFEYDFVESEPERKAASERAVRRWERQQKSGQVWPPGILIREDGKLQRDLISEFLSRRDDRDVQLPE